MKVEMLKGSPIIKRGNRIEIVKMEEYYENGQKKREVKIKE